MNLSAYRTERSVTSIGMRNLVLIGLTFLIMAGCTLAKRTPPASAQPTPEVANPMNKDNKATDDKTSPNSNSSGTTTPLPNSSPTPSPSPSSSPETMTPQASSPSPWPLKPTPRSGLPNKSDDPEILKVNWHFEGSDESVKNFYQEECPTCSLGELRKREIGRRRSLERDGFLDLTLQPGFYSIKSPLIPRNVQQTEQALFMALILSKDSSRYQARPASEIREELNKIKDRGSPRDGDPKSSLDPLTAQILKSFLERCQKKNKTICQVPRFDSAIIGKATAFVLLGSESQLFTSPHLTNEAMSEIVDLGQENQTTSTSELNLNLYLFNSKGILISTPDTNQFRISNHSSNKTQGTYSSESSAEPLKIDLAKPLRHIKGIPRAKNTAKENDIIFSPHYSNKTGANSSYKDLKEWSLWGTRYPFPNSNEAKLEVGIGHIISHSSEGITSNADATPASLGGPLLNENGEFLGINVGLDSNANEEFGPLRIIQLTSKSLD